ncbi:MAG: M13 family metallopeptidase [Caulobacteraceae bacterium]
MKTILFAAASTAALLLISAPASAGDAAPTVKSYGTWGFDTTAMDPKVKPGDSFFDYANGAWYAKTEIPADQGSASPSYDLYNMSQAQLRAIIEDSARNPSTPNAQKIGDLYKAFMDEARIEQLGDAPLQADLARIKAVKTKSGMAALMGATHAGFGSSIFGGYVDADPKASKRYAVSFGQGGLGLPDRDYYLVESFKPKKDAYRAYVGRALAMAGWPNPEAAADQVLAFETRLAEVSWARADRRERDKTYNPVKVADLAAFAPGIDWTAFLRGADLAGVDQVILRENTAFPKIAAIYAETPLETVKAWQAFHTIDQASPYLPRRYVDSRFDFRGKALQGLQENRPRWKRAVVTVEGALGEVVGQEYVARYFPPESKAKMEALIGNLKDAMGDRIRNVTWMSPATKAQALEKLAKMRVRVGYPNYWRNYDGLKIVAGDLYGDIHRSNAFDWAYSVGKLKEPVNQEEWYITPQTINAYSDPSRNVIVFPAAYLQPPHFDPKADPAVNYGAIGGVIGHEIGHAFDDQGRKYDANGELRDWWTKEDAERYQAATVKLAAQYDAYEIGGLHVNGKLTMGENIGDLTGLTLALEAYHKSLDGKPAPVIDGMTGDQRVFLGWAQVWRGKQREDAVKQQIASDPHSPDRFRANAPRNLDAWYAAFDVKPGDKLYVAPEDRVRIW